MAEDIERLLRTYTNNNNNNCNIQTSFIFVHTANFIASSNVVCFIYIIANYKRDIFAIET